MNERLLIVDDDRDICRYVEVNLTLEGYEVHVEHDGESAVATALKLQPDLVLLDVMMPGLDGYQVCKRLRTDPRTANTSVIMLTAKSLSADKVKVSPVACAVTLYEAARQRSAVGAYDQPKLTEIELERLTDDWLRR